MDVSPKRFFTEDLTINQKVGQMVMVHAFGRFRSTDAEEYRDLYRLVDEQHIGGFKLYHGYSLGTALLLSHLESATKIPLFVAADLERGLGQQIVDAPAFPAMAALGATGDAELATRVGFHMAVEAGLLGINMLFVPLLDLHTPGDTYFGTRCLGGDPEEVGVLGVALAKGIHEAGALNVAKYFPGHGRQILESDGSSHVDAEETRLRSSDLIPFQQAILNNVDAIMVGPGAFPALDPSFWDSDSGTIPALLSKQITTDLLRNDLGFSGLIFTDALNLPFLLRNHTMCEISTKAVAAGCDTLVALATPQDAIEALRGIYNALDKGMITEGQLDTSVTRILNAKYRINIKRLGQEPLANQNTAFGSDRTLRVIEETAIRSVSLLATPKTGFPITKRPIQLSVLVIGKCQAWEQIRADPWWSWHPCTFPEGVEFKIFEIDPNNNVRHIMRRVVGQVAVLVLLASDDKAVHTLQKYVRVFNVRNVKPVLVLSVAPNIASCLATIGWASLWTADMEQASWLAAMNVIIGEITSCGQLPFPN